MSPHATAPRRVWSRGVRLVAGVLVALVLLVGLELSLRSSLGPPPPPVRVFSALSEHERYLVADGDRLLTPYIDTDPPAVSLPGSGPRCAVLGGSSVHGGSPVRASAEFPALLGRALGIDVVNLASPGLDSFDMVRIVEDMVRWKWSCIVLYGPHNDFGNAVFQSRFGTPLGAAGAHANAFLSRFQLYAQLGRLVVGASGQARRKDTTTAVGEGSLQGPRHAAALDYLVANHRRMLWLAKQAGIRAIVVSPVAEITGTPSVDCNSGECAGSVYREAQRLADVDPVRAAALLRRARDIDPVALRAPTEAGERLRATAEAEGAVYAEVEPLLPQHATLPVPAPDLFVDPVHFSAKGHRAMAVALEPFVAKAAFARR